MLYFGPHDDTIRYVRVQQTGDPSYSTYDDLSSYTAVKVRILRSKPSLHRHVFVHSAHPLTCD